MCTARSWSSPTAWREACIGTTLTRYSGFLLVRALATYMKYGQIWCDGRSFRYTYGDMARRSDLLAYTLPTLGTFSPSRAFQCVASAFSCTLSLFNVLCGYSRNCSWRRGRHVGVEHLSPHGGVVRGDGYRSCLPHAKPSSLPGAADIHRESCRRQGDCSQLPITT